MISMQTCTHPTQVHTPACISTYVSSCLYSPELLAHHTPTPVTHLKRTSIHTQDVKRHRHIQIEGWEHAVLKHLFLYLFLAHFCHNYNYLSNQRIVLIPPPASEFVLKPSLRQGHGKAREAQAASWGRRGRLGQSSRCFPTSRLVFSSVGGGGRGGSQSEERSPGPTRRRGRSHGARARGARLSPARSGPALLSALPAARPSPASPRPRSAGSAEVGPPTPRPSARAALENPAPKRSSRCQAGPSAGAAPTREAAQLRGSGAAAAAPAVGGGAELQPAPHAPGRPHLRGTPAVRGGAGQGGAEAPERIPEAPPPGSPFLSAAEDADSDLPEEGET